MRTNRKLVTACLMAAMFLSAMEVNIVSTAMPTIVGKLGGFSHFTWVFSLFMLTQAASIPIYGKLADLYGRKPVFAVGIGFFILGSALCGLAHSMPQLIIYRGIQGLGAGAVMPIAMTIIGDLYPGAERARVQGLLSSVWAIAAIVGPALGGVIVQTIGWPWIFEINVPLGILASSGVFLFLHEKASRHDHEIDYLGAFLLVVSVSLLLFGLMQAGTRWGWSSPQIIGLFFGAAIVFVFFLRVEAQAKEPILPLSLMNQRMILVGNICSIITGGLTVGSSSFLPTFAQGVLGTTAMIAGTTIITMSIGWPIASTLSGKLMWRYGYRAIEVWGMVFCLIASVLYLLISPSSAPWYMSFCSLVMGAGLGLAATTQIVSVQTSVSWKQRGIATSSVMFSRILGSTLLIAVLGTIVNSSLIKSLSGTFLTKAFGAADPVSIINLLLDPGRRASIPVNHLEILKNALAGSIHLTFWVILACSAAGIFASLYMPRGVPDENGQLINSV
ncbi:MAG: MDR family MFS transporter [Actinomycetota bacterium]|nr:MDR family MFS transporter [Actinomycetota bacterium]